MLFRAKEGDNAEYKVYVFGGCIGDYDSIDDLFEFDFTQIVNSQYYNPTNSRFIELEEEKVVQTQERLKPFGTRDVSMEKEDEVRLTQIGTQKLIRDDVIVWNKENSSRLAN